MLSWQVQNVGDPWAVGGWQSAEIDAAADGDGGYTSWSVLPIDVSEISMAWSSSLLISFPVVERVHAGGEKYPELSPTSASPCSYKSPSMSSSYCAESFSGDVMVDVVDGDDDVGCPLPESAQEPDDDAVVVVLVAAAAAVVDAVVGDTGTGLVVFICVTLYMSWAAPFSMASAAV